MYGATMMFFCSVMRFFWQIHLDELRVDFLRVHISLHPSNRFDDLPQGVKHH